MQCARNFIASAYPAAGTPIWQGERYDHSRIRVAYLSADFREHAVPYLLAGVFESHDRTRFETTAISFGPDNPDKMLTRLKGAFDRFIDVSGQSDLEVARLMRSLEVDIAIDLMGHTMNSRFGILAWRPAPVQVNFLGYPGTSGADYVDYIIADRHVIPKKYRKDYVEQVVYLPDTFQPNDSLRKVSHNYLSRSECGLPEVGFVFCSFNNNYKIAPQLFDVWMRLLRAVEGSVLWMFSSSPAAEGNLQREAQARGVAPDRLIFAPRVAYEDHLARQRYGDLFLDTLPYNAGITASDALWAGLPVLTCSGEAFTARMAGSLLKAIGLPELITGVAGGL